MRVPGVRREAAAMKTPDRIYRHGRFWVAAGSLVAALWSILGLPWARLLHDRWDEWAVAAAAVYAFFSLRGEMRRQRQRGIE